MQIISTRLSSILASAARGLHPLAWVRELKIPIQLSLIDHRMDSLTSALDTTTLNYTVEGDKTSS